MADNYLITGYWGEPHVTAENDRGIHAAIFGKGRFVLPVGEQFKAEYIGNNTIRIYDGKLMDNGAAAGIPAGEYVDLAISNASQGMNRNDLIVFQYSQDASTLIESGTFVVVQGTETAEAATDPALTQEDLLSGNATFDQMALWRVPVSGVAISAPVQMFQTKSVGKEPVTYTLTKDANGDIVLTGSDGSTNTVTDEMASGEDYSGMQMLVNEEVNALSFSTTNTLWRFAIVEIKTTNNTTSYVQCVLTPYHLTGTYQVFGSGYSITGTNTVYLSMVRSSSKTTWTLVDGASNGYKITRIRAYR